MKYQVNIKLKLCIYCGERFPEHLIEPIHASDDFLNGKEFCPLCARKLINRITGLPEDESFRGPIAQKLYEEAEEWIDRARRGE